MEERKVYYNAKETINEETSSSSDSAPSSPEVSFEAYVNGQKEVSNKKAQVYRRSAQVQRRKDSPKPKKGA